VAKDYTYDGGGNSFRQIFYIYTKPKNFPSHKNKQSVVLPVKTDSAIQITPIVQSADTAKTNNTTPINQTEPTPPPNQAQTTYNYPDINTTPFNPRNGDPWRYAYDGSKLFIKKKGSDKSYNLMDPDYFKTYPNSKIKTTEKLEKAKAAIKQYYGNQLGYK
jgi:hypothetical protein